jgi:hypothetical protein
LSQITGANTLLDDFPAFDILEHREPMLSPFLGLFFGLWIIYHKWIQVSSIVARHLKNPTGPC